MKKILLLFVLFGLIFNQVDAQRNFVAKKLLFGQVQKPYINFGYLYNWYAATDSRNIANTGWSVPTLTDLNTFCTYVGNSSNPRIKDTNSIYWRSGTTNTNELSFNARGAGARNNFTGDFGALKETTYLWQSTDTRVVSIVYNTTTLGVGGVPQSEKLGFSIRLIYTGIGNPTSYTGNDGKIYRVVTINGITYTADNLAETLYRDGSTIPVVTDNAAWAALTTGARCVYNNDENNR